jgi:hypothetical protein
MGLARGSHALTDSWFDICSRLRCPRCLLGGVVGLWAASDTLNAEWKGGCVPSVKSL